MSQLKTNEIEFQLYVADSGRVIHVRREGRLFIVAGVDISLFPIGILCEAIGRDVQTIRRWERAGLWPKPQWKVPDKRCKRWYSGNQITKIHEIYWDLSKGDYGYSHSPHFPLTKFFNQVRNIFYKADLEAVKRKDVTNG